jgi:threonine/homoserine/homoserine lactone efflux protein
MPATLVAFLLASIALLLVPGPSVLYVVARSVSQGRRAGFVSVAGGAMGNLVHVIAATVGLSALLASSALAFSVVKYAGAAYLIYLGMRTLLSNAPVDLILAQPQPPRRVFAQAVLVYALNPKTALFFLAFLPQFADPARGAIGPQLFLLGCLFVLLALCTDSGYALLAGGLAQRLRATARLWRWQRWFSGGIYLVLGVTTALSGAERK